MPGRPAAPVSSESSRRLVLVRAANVTIRCDLSMTEPFRTRFEGRPPTVRAEDDAVTLEYPRFAIGPRRPYRSTVILNGLVPWRIEARGPLTSLTADLGGVELQALDVNQGATRLLVTLPRPTGEVPIQASGGVVDSTFRRPVGVPARVYIRGGASGLALDDQRFKAVGGEVNWQSEDWERSTDRYHLAFLRGTRDLTVDTVDAPAAAAGRTGRGLATVLFTDIVASTERARQEGDRRWRELLDRHDASARRVVDGERGELVKTTGDGILAVFESPGAAIAGVRALRDELRAIGIDIRAGLHTGEIEYRGADLGGIGVHIAARIMNAAGPGEILVSRTVRDLVAGSDVALEDRGTRPLKGVGDWQVFAVD
jgi:class 3 adenylate cyclase